MRHHWILGLALFILAGCFDGVTDKPPPTNPPWALGDKLHVTGTLVNWALGHAVPPTAELFYGFMFIGEDFEEGIELAEGMVQSDGSFKFIDLCIDKKFCARPVSDVLCGGLSVSDPQLGVSIIDAIEIDGLEVGDAWPPPRPVGWVIISTERPRNFEILYHGRTYTYAYADRNATVKGTCAFGPVELDLRKGWNSIERNPAAGGYKTAAIPADAKWWFLNPYTMVE